MQEGAAISTAAYPVRTSGRGCHAQGGTSSVEVKLPNASHISIPIFSCGSNKENLAHIVAVLRIIEQKGLPKKCRVLAKAVVKRSEALKNLKKALES